MCNLRLVDDGWTEEPERDRRRAIELGRRALQVAENDPGVLATTAVVLAQLGDDIGAMIGLVDRALALNPSYARGWYRSGVLRLWAGQPDLAIQHLDSSLRLSPRERIGTPLSVMAEAYFFKHQFDEAAAMLLLAIQDNPGLPGAYRFLAACYAHLGRLDEARATIARLRTITAEVMPSVLPWRKAEHCELLVSGLRLAIGDTE
jgi:adenylate cyclase